MLLQLKKHLHSNLIFFLELPYIILLIILGFVLPISFFIDIFSTGIDKYLTYLFVSTLLFYISGFLIRSRFFKQDNHYYEVGFSKFIISEYLYLVASMSFLIILGMELFESGYEIFNSFEGIILRSYLLEIFVISKVLLYGFTLYGFLMLVFSTVITIIDKTKRNFLDSVLLLFFLLIVVFVIYDLSTNSGGFINYIINLKDMLIGPALIYYLYIVYRGSLNLERVIAQDTHSVD